MKAKDIMTSPVITAEPETPVREIGRKPLQAMYDSHIVNIGICDKQLKP